MKLLPSLPDSVSEFFSLLFVADPVLRRWALDRLRNRWPQTESFTAHKPPYLPAVPAETAKGDGGFKALASSGMPAGSLILTLPSENVRVEASETRSLFIRDFEEEETEQGLHAFSWLPLQPDTDPVWVTALWRGWSAHHSLPQTDTPIWSAAVAARRALNILDHSRHTGALPGPKKRTATSLAVHASTILERLDWREDGSHDTRLIAEACALFRIGLAFGLDHHAEAGFTILVEEGRRQFGSSGLISQGSTHHHLVAAMDVAGAWLAAHAKGRAETVALEALLRRLLSPLPALAIDGILPWVGDLSFEFPPDFLAGLLADAPLDRGWTALLPEADRAMFAALRDSSRLYDLETLRADGWLRQTIGPWSGLWHAFPNGWSPVRGYGHADIGAAVLHYKGIPIFADPGNGASGSEGRVYRSAAAHGGLTIDGTDPYPCNRAIYCEAFRRDVAGKPPVLRAEYDGVSCIFEGYRRILGHVEVQRRWRFDGPSMILDDVINGTGRGMLVRKLITPHPVALQEDGSVILSAPGNSFRIRSEIPAVLRPGKIWTAWGVSRPAQAIVFACRKNLPWQGRITVEPIAP